MKLKLVKSMEVDEIEIQKHVSKFQRVCSNNSTTTTDTYPNPPQRIVSNGSTDHDDVVLPAVSNSNLCGWPSSRIVRVSRTSGGKDRHSKVLTSKGLRDRRVRLSVSTAIQFYDLQDRLGFDQPSKAVEWLLKAASTSIDELPSLDPPFAGIISGEKKKTQNQENVTKSPACSSTSETSKGSGLSLSRCENRNKAREMATKKDKTRVRVLTQVNNGMLTENSSSFTDLLTGGINININNNNNTSRSHMDYFYTGGGDNYNFLPAVTGGGESCYNLNFAMTSSAAVTTTGAGFSRGTLQSNLQTGFLPHHHHNHYFQSASVDGSTAGNLPFFIVPNSTVDYYPGTVGYNINYGGDGGGRRSDHHQKEKSKN